MSSPAFQFKGSGWYVTDYARKGAGGSSGDESKGEKPAASSADSESKPAAKEPGGKEPAAKEPAKADKPAPAASPSKDS